MAKLVRHIENSILFNIQFTKNLDDFLLKFWIGAVQRFTNFVEDLEKCSKMSIWLQKSALIQPRASLFKFGFIFSSSFIRLRGRQLLRGGLAEKERANAREPAEKDWDGSKSKFISKWLRTCLMSLHVEPAPQPSVGKMAPEIARERSQQQIRPALIQSRSWRSPWQMGSHTSSTGAALLPVLQIWLWRKFISSSAVRETDAVRSVWVSSQNGRRLVTVDLKANQARWVVCCSGLMRFLAREEREMPPTVWGITAVGGWTSMTSHRTWAFFSPMGSTRSTPSPLIHDCRADFRKA